MTGVLSRSVREVPAFASRHKVWAGIVIVLAILAVVIYLPRLPLVGPRSGREAEGAFRGHLLQAFAGLVLAAGAVYTARTFALNREGQITERFTRAVEQLADEKLDIRLGGIYALERIARDSETHYESVMEVLTAFLREHARWRPETAASSSDSVSSAEWAREPRYASSVLVECRVDFQAAATVIGRRDRSHERTDYRLDLRGVGLQGASLNEAHLDEANLTGAYLFKTYLSKAHLSKANLSGADLTGANLSGADLSEGRLVMTTLSGASLSRADLSEAELATADLSGANLFQADLTGANLTGANLFQADLTGTNLSEARLFKANLSGADLSRAIGLTHEQVASAMTDEETKLPEYLDREASLDR